MVRTAIESCPDELWNAGNGQRQFWRLAYHVLYFTHLYLEVREETFEPWLKIPEGIDDWEAFDTRLEPFTKAELLGYCDHLDGTVSAKLAVIDLDSPESGFNWYHIPKLDHQILNIRHVQEHAGQLRDRLLEHGVDQDWVGRVL